MANPSQLADQVLDELLGRVLDGASSGDLFEEIIAWAKRKGYFQTAVEVNVWF